MLENRKSELLQSIYEDLDTLEDVHDLIEGSIVDDPPSPYGKAASSGRATIRRWTSSERT